MSKKVSDKDIYSFLASEDPEIFSPLLSEPRNIPEPGPPPSKPSQSKYISVTLEPGDSMEKLLEEAERHLPRGFTRLRSSSITISSVESNVGWPRRITFALVVPNKNWTEELKAFREHKANWERLVEAHQKFKSEKKDVKSRNRDKMRQARERYLDLWIAAGRYLKHKIKDDYLVSKRAKLQREIDAIDLIISREVEDGIQEAG